MSGIRRPAEIVVEKLQLLAAVHNQASILAQEIAAMLDIDRDANLFESLTSPPGITCRYGPFSPRHDDPTVDRNTLSIQWRGRTCCLGNTLAFWLFERLARRPGQLVSNQQLLEDVWDGVRSKEAIRSVVKVLRQKLREAGMDELAAAIDGSNRDHYGLKLPT